VTSLIAICSALAIAALLSLGANRIGRLFERGGIKAFLAGLFAGMALRLGALAAVGLGCRQWAPEATTPAMLGALLVVAIGLALDVRSRLVSLPKPPPDRDPR
jgi:urea transporter